MSFYLQIKILGVINKNNEEVTLACLGSEIPTAKVAKKNTIGNKWRNKKEGKPSRTGRPA
ncbi:hypothetical protein BCT69_19495 [Enterovibrio norvegicus]|nr:hypothetical protein BCT69_19495 [Enterovibrio norvegicus]